MRVFATIVSFVATAAEVAIEVSRIQAAMGMSIVALMKLVATVELVATVVITVARRIAVARSMVPIEITPLLTAAVVVPASEVGSTMMASAVMHVSVMEAEVLRMTSLRREAAAPSAFAIAIEAAMGVEVESTVEVVAAVHARTTLSMMLTMEAGAAVETRVAVKSAASVKLRTAEVRPAELRAVAVHGVMPMSEHSLELLPAAASDVGLLRADVGTARPLPFRRTLRIVWRTWAILAHRFGAARVETRLRSRLEVRSVAGFEIGPLRFVWFGFALLQQLLDVL